MAETEFRVTYDGPAIEGGRMPVRELAPAVLALGELVSDASLLLQPEKGRVGLEIEATEAGSFEILLVLSAPAGAWDQVQNTFSSDGMTALVNLKELLVGAGVGLFFLVTQLRGRKIQEEKPAASPGMVRLVIDDDLELEVPTDTLRLYRSKPIREKAAEVVAPLKQDGIGSVRFSSDGQSQVTVREVEVSSFELPASEDRPLGDNQYEMALSIAALAFADGNKWRLSDGDSTFYASIEDEAFLDEVDRGIAAFRKGDILRCRLEVTQVQAADGLRTTRRVLEVIEHIPMEVQLPLEIEAAQPKALGPGDDG